jgi:thioredoxin reductase (NADPH)
VIASGAQYRKLQVPQLQRFEGAGVYYSATEMEAQLCEGEDVVVVGGANSAGQAAAYLSAKCRHVDVLVRGPSLSQTMSRYLIQRLEEEPRISVRPYTEVVGLEGQERLERLVIRDVRTDRTETLPIRHLFVMTGANPNSDWLAKCVALDDKGFVKTGPDLSQEDLQKWPLARRPLLLETSIPGVFAVGDVRCGNVKRVASAVGEGSISIQMVHRVLAG